MILLALVLAAAGVLLACGPPARQLAPRRPPDLPEWLAARPGAMAARTRLILAGAIAVVVVLLFEAAGGVLAVLAAGLVGGAVFVVLGRIEPDSVQRARERRIQELPHALELLAGCLASGLPLRRGVREVAGVMSGPVGEDLALVVGLLDVGLDERTAWLALRGTPGWQGVARDIARAAGVGSGLRSCLERHSERARRAAAARRQERARTVGVRSVLPLMMCFLPAFVLVGIVPTVGSMVVKLLNLK